MFSHLNALNVRLSNDRTRLAAAKNGKAKAFFSMLVAQDEKEIAGEYKFLGITPGQSVVASDDDLLAALGM